MTDIAVFFVTEPEYAKLQRLSPTEFTLPYKKYTEYVETRNRQLPRELKPVKVYVNIDEFIRWCTSSKVNPNTGSARAAFATDLLARKHN